MSTAEVSGATSVETTTITDRSKPGRIIDPALRCCKIIEDAELFKSLPIKDRDRVLARASMRAVPKGRFIAQQGEPAKEMFLLESGRLRIFEVTAHGHELLIRFARPGDVFGDKAAIAGSHYGAWAVSDTPVHVYSWTTETITALMTQVPQLCVNLLAIATRYLHSSRERYRMLATEPVARRVYWALSELARSFGSANGKGTVISSATLQKDIAGLAGTTVYTVNRVLRRYEQRGMLTTKRGRIILAPSFH
jgi:CRP/FNR family transcriptional regulator, nitrogen oxide reductase regulator